METKKCTICKEYLALSAFSKDKVTNTGYRPGCKDCESLRRKELILQKGGKIHVNRRKDKIGFKTCGFCKLEKPHKDFYKSKITKDKLLTNCKICTSNLSKKNYKNPKKRAKLFCSGYHKIDRKKGLISDLTPEFVYNIVTSPCFYCGEISDNIGCDRVDNTKNHLINNVVPCCYLCNSVKSDKFSKQEMIEIGKVIRKIKQRRKING